MAIDHQALTRILMDRFILLVELYFLLVAKELISHSTSELTVTGI